MIHTSLVYRYQDVWRYATRPFDPPVCVPLAAFLNEACDYPSGGLIDAEVLIEIDNDGEPLSVSCNGHTSRDRYLLDSLEAIEGERYRDEALA